MIQSVAVLGAGAVGSYVIWGLSSRNDIRLGVIAEGERAVRLKKDGCVINDTVYHPEVWAPQEAHDVDLLIVCLKYGSLQGALDSIKEIVGEHTTVMSLMNGVDSEEIIGERYGAEHMIYAVAQGMDAMKFGAELTYSKMGVLCIGARLESQQEGLDRVCCLFDRTELPYVREKDILHRLWSKFMLNVGVNQTCMVYSCTYGDVWRPGKERDTMIGAMREVIAVANAEGIDLSESDLEEYDRIIRTLRADGTPSMGQDRIARRHSEVEMFAGTVIRRGQKAGIPTPVNQWLYDQVQEIEKSY